MVVIKEADGEVAVDVGGGVGAGVAVGVKVGAGAGGGVDVGAADGVKVGAGVGEGVDVGVGDGVKVGVRVGEDDGTGLTDRPQLSVRNPIRRRENARRLLLTSRPIVRKVRSKCDLGYRKLRNVQTISFFGGSRSLNVVAKGAWRALLATHGAALASWKKRQTQLTEEKATIHPTSVRPLSWRKFLKCGLAVQKGVSALKRLVVGTSRGKIASFWASGQTCNIKSCLGGLD